MAGLEAMISQMERWLGTREPNSIQSWYRQRNGSAYSNNFPWCDATVTRAAYDSGNHDTVCFGTDYAYTVAHAARFNTKKQWTAMVNGIAKSGIRRGDIIFFDWDGSSSIGAIDHIGIVTSVKGTTVYTIEGNTANVCARRARYVHDIAGFGRPKYRAAGKTTKPTVDLSKVRAAAKADPPKKGTPVSYSGVKTVEKALVAEGLLASSRADGHFGSDTVTAYSKWQQRLGHKGTKPGQDADGIPGRSTLAALGKKHGFTVVA